MKIFEKTRDYAIYILNEAKNTELGFLEIVKFSTLDDDYIDLRHSNYKKLKSSYSNKLKEVITEDGYELQQLKNNKMIL
ncbi:MAG: hypothetical protein Q9M91_07645 [Candidatus Dojkabacteria bacterium]|nr:hypothetical protein [Candidatus Dojkabacteria bacterium]